MIVENNLYKDFKSYESYQNIKTKEKKGIDKKAVMGALSGVALGLVVSKGIYKHDFFKEMGDEVLQSPKDKLKYTAKDVASMLTMAGLSNLGAILFSSKNDSKEEKKKKIHEAQFQIMNTSIPMLLVTGANILCDNVKALNNKGAKIVSSLGAMVTGAALASKITNLNKAPNQEKRKYTIKDSVANFDDIIATFVVGFPQLGKLNVVAKTLLPFIYTYCGSRVSEEK